ncbi:hypothetical protein Smp_172610 [Schistosoma mansoni]|uniref:hypothetical protein n=1 Tax=Schistosoma mansoni TaxID=6183 RepID=UPI00022DC0EF|nr:hypothetical protein Smp_172610 [Schistosoma mansoni]|eukprot:XP_018651648.1 hypothetical protein Smp_172610 [Schistosoma mansoni]
MENPGAGTPVKICPYGEEFGITTPSGGLIFNPFHKEFLSRVEQVNFSPGIFAYNPSPISKSGSRKTTPNRIKTPFILSPDIQGELFPVDIDENPVLQLKLQEKLDTQCDDEIQNRIHSFFKSHLIAPSPDTVVFDSPTKSTPLGKKKKNSYLLGNNSSCMCEVAVQTSISMPPSFDFESVMQIAFEQNHSMKNLSAAKSSVTLSITSNKMITNDDKSDSQRKSDPFANNISLSACAVDRPIPCNSNNNSLSILHKNSRHLLSRRSLFSDSSEINEEPSYTVVDDNELNEQQRTLTSSDDLSRHHHHDNLNFSSIVAQPTCSNYLSSTQMDYGSSHTKFSIDKSSPKNESSSLLIKETAALQMYNSVSMHTLNRTTVEHNPKNIDHNDNAIYFDDTDTNVNYYKCIDYCSSQINSPQYQQQFRCGSTSPNVCYTDISFQSPDLSPILPIHRKNSCTNYPPSTVEVKDISLNQTNIHINGSSSSNHDIMPAKCLFPPNLNGSS